MNKCQGNEISLRSVLFVILRLSVFYWAVLKVGVVKYLRFVFGFVILRYYVFYLLGNCVVLQFSKLQKSLLIEVSFANDNHDSDFFIAITDF